MTILSDKWEKELRETTVLGLFELRELIKAEMERRSKWRPPITITRKGE